MGAFLNNLYEESIATEIAYYIGRRVAEIELGQRHRLIDKEKPNYEVIMRGNKYQLLAELDKLENNE